MDMKAKVAAAVLTVVATHLPEMKASPYIAERRRRERATRHLKSSWMERWKASDLRFPSPQTAEYGAGHGAK